MKVVVILLAACCGAALASPRLRRQAPQEPIPIISFVNDNNYDGSYKYRYEAGNGIKVEESGSVRNPGTADEVRTARGSYSYTAPDGRLIEVRWFADETGFHAEGAHLPGSSQIRVFTPTPPPLTTAPTTERPEQMFPPYAAYPVMPRGNYETGNGISYSEEGVLKNAGSENEAQSAQGTYSYTAPNGLLVTVTWTSDETGYHPRVSYQQSG